MPFVAPQLSVISQSRDGSDVVTVLGGSVAPYRDRVEELAPAGLYDLETQSRLAFPLHKIVLFGNNSYTFRTFAAKVPERSRAGLHFVYRQWWTEDAWRAVTDRSLVWVRQPYPDNGAHAHCLITWETIAAYHEKNREGYHCGGDWVTVEAYEKFIREDVYRCRVRA